jgi:uncharacterized membrane protein
VSSIAGAVAFASLMVFAPWQISALVGWDVAAGVMVTWVLSAVLARSGAATAVIATREDNSRFVTDALLLSASVVSLVGVGFALVKASSQRGAAKATTTGVGVLTVVLAWAVVHTVYMLRYARLFYAEQGGIDFSGEADPDYRDFAYLAFTIGMTYQVSDTQLTTKSIRRTATHHALLSYLFGTVVVAMTINVVAGLLR